MLIAIQPDDYTNHTTGAPLSNASSPKWAEALRTAGHDVRWVNVYDADIIAHLEGCHGFMWRWGHCRGMERVARRLLPVIERDLGLILYPDQKTCWHYDDKISQAYLFQAHGIPAPDTWVWFDKEKALQWVATARYPCVIKLSGGAGSENIALVNDAAEARAWIDLLFDWGLFKLQRPTWHAHTQWPWRIRLRAAAKAILKGRALGPASGTPWDDRGDYYHRGYVMFQEFLPGNDYDTRVTVIGNRAFAFRRHNRPNDFRASGSGLIDYDESGIDMAFVRLAFDVARRLGTQSCAIDGLYRGREAVVGEISYTYVSAAVQDCPGHWVISSRDGCDNLDWNPGHMWPEEAQIQDYIKRLESHHECRSQG